MRVAVPLESLSEAFRGLREMFRDRRLLLRVALGLVAMLAGVAIIAWWPR